MAPTVLRRMKGESGQPDGPILGVGPVSRNTVEATIAASYALHTPVALVASRRQCDAAEIGRGYVEGWATEDFVRYVRAADPEGRIILCRDHGGPWQHPTERGLAEEEVMAAAARSLENDIDAGMQILHIDTSMGPNGEVEVAVAIDRLLALYDTAHVHARRRKRAVNFEIGFEDQRDSVNDPEEFEANLHGVLTELERRRLPRPRFVVAQTGTKVVETRNTGALTRAETRAQVSATIRALTAICDRLGVRLKAHNCDYLDDDAWGALRRSAIGGANVAPEYGTLETMTFLQLLESAALTDERDRFLGLALASGAWSKWMATASAATDLDRAVIAGHYVFSTPECHEMKRLLGERIGGGEQAVDDLLRRAIEQRILLHLQHLNGVAQPPHGVADQAPR